MLRWIGVVLLLVVGVLPAGCSKEPRYSQDSPEQLIDSARKMIEDGRADRLASLVYAENEEMRRFLNRFGVFLGNLQKLGVSIEKAFPEDIAKLKADAVKLEKSGQEASLLGQLSKAARPNLGGRRQRGGARGGPPMGAERQAFEVAMKRVMVDPYGFLRESQGKLSAVYLTDDKVSLRWEDKPILPPIGLQLKRGGDDKWYFMLPTGLPGVSQFMPRTPTEYQIWGSLVGVFDKVIVELRNDVETKRVTTLDGVSRRAGEKAFLPAAMVVFAYTKAMEDRKRAPATGTTPASPPSNPKPTLPST